MKAVKLAVNNLNMSHISQPADTAHPASLNYFKKEEPLKLRVRIL